MRRIFNSISITKKKNNNKIRFLEFIVQKERDIEKGKEREVRKGKERKTRRGNEGKIRNKKEKTVEEQ